MANEVPQTVYGRLLESVHISGYTMERACTGLEYLLDEDRWKSVGDGGFNDIDAFSKSIDLSQFKIAVDRRKKLAKRLEELGATQRATAKALGVTHTTVQNDLGKKLPKPEKKDRDSEDRATPTGNNLPSPLSVSGPQIWKTAEKRTERQGNSKSTKVPAMGEAKADLRRGDFREVLSDIKAGSVSLILTDPPYGKKYLELWKDLGTFAARVLSPTGILIAYSGQMYLPECLSSLSESLLYWWTGAVIHKHSGLSPLGHPVRKVINAWKPLLMYVRKDGEGFPDVFSDLVRGEGEDKEAHNWAQPLAEAIWIVEHFSEPGSLVVDPMAGSGTVGVACKEAVRNFIGSEIIDG